VTLCPNEAVAGADEMYRADGMATQPALLLDEATKAITDASSRIRCGSVLEERDAAATGVVLGDLFDGLSKLTELWITLPSQYAIIDPLHIGRLEDQLQTLRMMMLSAQQVAEELKLSGGATATSRRRGSFAPTVAGSADFDLLALTDQRGKLGRSRTRC
jgi:hypothetical protein